MQFRTCSKPPDILRQEVLTIEWRERLAAEEWASRLLSLGTPRKERETLLQSVQWVSHINE